MKYMLMFYLNQTEFDSRTDPKTRDAYWGNFMPYVKAIKDAGIFAGGAGLEPPDTATTLRIIDGRRVVQDGPFAETKEQLGGYFLIDVPDLDAALEWAARYPAGSGGGVEIRPTMTGPAGE